MLDRKLRPKYSLLESMTNCLAFFYMLIVVFIIIIACMQAQERKEKCEEPKTYNGFATEGELNAMRYLHRYHGTDYSEDGYFYRDGVRHSLWDPRVRTDM